MADRQRSAPLLDTFLFSAAYTSIDAARLEAIPVARELTAWPLPKTSRSHPERHDLGLQAIADSSFMVQSARAAKRPANWVRKLQTLHAALGKPLHDRGIQLIPGPLLSDSDHGSSTPDQLRSEGLRLIVPFNRPNDFGKLMAAVRVVLPLLPAFSASSPFEGGTTSGARSTRILRWIDSRTGHPERLGGFIPEPHFDRDDHDREVLGPIAQAIARSGNDPAIEAHRLDWRAATVLSEPDAIALNAIDMQENPAADMAVLEFTIAVLRALCNGRWVSSYLQRAWSSEDLLEIMRATIAQGSDALITNRDYLLMFGLMKQDELSAEKLVQHLFVEVYSELSENARTCMARILEHGELAKRMLVHAGERPDQAQIAATIRALAACLTGTPF